MNRPVVAAFVALGIVPLLSAATPVAVWDGFDSLTSGNYTWTKSEWTTVNDGVVLIGPKGGLSLELTGGTIYSNRALTLIIDAEIPSVTGECALIDITQFGNEICLTYNGETLYHRWNTVADLYGSSSWNPTDRQMIAFTYKGDSQAEDRGMTTYVDGSLKIHDQRLETGSGNITSICIGTAKRSDMKVPAGMRIYRAMLFDTSLSAEDIVIDPSPLPEYARFVYSGVFTWTGMGTSFLGPFPRFNCVTGTDGSDKGEWSIFQKGGLKYEDSGAVMRYVKGYSKSVDASFSPLSFGGMIVECGADGYEVTDNGKNNVDRATELGDTRTSGGVPTWFVYNESFTIRRNGTTTLFGDINFDVASGRFVDLNSGHEEHALTLDRATAAHLHLHGEGKLTVATLTATGAVTLDYSDLALRVSTEPYICGTLAIDDSTVIKLPPTVMAGQPYRLATTITGPLSGQPSMRRIYIGDMPVSREVTFDTANGTIVYAGDVGRTARIDERSYRTLEEALSDVRAGETVTLISNIAVNEVIATTKADFFLDLAGHDFVLNAPFMVGGVMTVVDSTASAGHIGLGDFLYGGYRLVAGKTCVDTLTTAEGCAFVPMLEEEGDYRYQVKPAQTSEGFVVPVKNTENKTFAEAVLAKTWIEEKTDRNLATAEGRALAVADLNRPRPVTAGTPNNGHTLNECYILGLSTESADSVPFATVGQNDSADTMLFLLGNVSVNAAAGVPVRFALIEVDSQSGVGSVVETKKGEATFSVAVPTVEESLKYYKIGYRIGE